MKTINAPIRFLWLLSIAQCCLGQAVGANAPVPVAIEKGFQLLKSAGPVPAFETWREGGVLAEVDKTTQDAATTKFKEMLKPFRGYLSYEVIEVKEIGQTSKILYLSIRFERGVLYGSFLVWRSERDWIVQHMDFNTKPEIIMPWLALGGGK
jgi:hypothetical protein